MYEGRAFSVRRDRVSLPEDQSTDLDIVEHRGAVVIVPVDADGNIWFVRQYRHPARVELLELPAGTLEQNEAPDECAAREIREEIGMAAGKLEEIGSFFLAPGYSTEYMYAFLAQGLTVSPLEGDADEFLAPEPVSLERTFEMVEEGSFQDAKTLAALHLARHILIKA
jgi:ADP-ribose pyrophosphatase